MKTFHQHTHRTPPTHLIAAVSLLLVLCTALIQAGCNTHKQQAFKPKEVYRSATLIITQLSPNTFQHTSFKQTNDFGNVPCNGLVVRNAQEAIIFDTPTNDQHAEELINWTNQTLHCKINAVVPTHFHDDCLGGLKAFEAHKIPSYAHTKTIELAKANNMATPQIAFTDSLVLRVGNTYAEVRFLGEGHTKDNVVGYFPDEHVLFGGCLIKTLHASKGYLGDANVNSWSETVTRVQQKYPQTRIVVPGHGDSGNQKLLEYTIKLFKTR